mgnify:CR=1 FL=1
MDSQTPSDAELVAATRAGNEQAAGQLYHRYADRVYRICYRVILDSRRAEECTQEIWLKVFRGAGRYSPDRPFASWLKAVAVRTAIDHSRKHYREWNHRSEYNTDFEAVDQKPNARQTADENYWLAEIKKALKTLSPAQRAAFIMRHYEGASVAEIAFVLNCAEGTVKSHIHRAVQEMRQALGPKMEENHAKTKERTSTD